MSPVVFKMAAFVAASSASLVLAISLAARLGGGKAPDGRGVVAVAALISAIGIMFGKYGQNFGLPWQVYYSVPAIATMVAPPVVFRFPPLNAIAYVLLAFLCAPVIHAAFFYGLGWSEYMPFLSLPR